MERRLKVINNQFIVENDTILLQVQNKDGVTKFIIPDYITEIAYRAFFGCDYEEIIIPNGVTKIGDESFCDCNNLKSIVIPSSVKEINSGAFHTCQKLSNIKINDGVIKIGNWAFAHCSFIDINLPNSLSEIGDHAFSFNSKLTHIDFPNSLEKIGNDLFEECQNLKEITIPIGLKNINSSLFSFSYVETINVYTYEIFDMLSCDLKYIAILSFVKNYYNKTIQYSKDDIEQFKKYIVMNKEFLLYRGKESIYLMRFILEEIDNLILLDDIMKLLISIKNVEIKAMLLEFRKNNFGFNQNPLDELDFGESDEINKVKIK